MGLRIGDTVSRLIPPRQVIEPDRYQNPRLEQREEPLVGAREPESLPGQPFFNREEPEPLRAGFGAGTVSTPAAAARTVGRTVRQARGMVPDLEELREEVRQRAGELREQFVEPAGREDEAPRTDLLEERVGAEVQARAQVRRFINRLNEAAGTARARVRGEEPPPPQRRTDIRVGDETVELFRRTPNIPQFDLRA